MKVPAHVYAAKIERVIDGDTYLMMVDLGFEVWKRVKIRLHGWSCPELSTKAGAEARTAASIALTLSPSIVVETFKDQRTFDRWVADVHVVASGSQVHLGQFLEQLGHAKPGARVG